MGGGGIQWGALLSYNFALSLLIVTTNVVVLCEYLKQEFPLWGTIKGYCIVLYCIVLYCIVLYCIVLYCIVLYCIVLYTSLFVCNEVFISKDNGRVRVEGWGECNYPGLEMTANGPVPQST